MGGPFASLFPATRPPEWLILIFLMFIYFWQRERQNMSRGGAERGGRHRIWSGLQALSCQHRAWHRAQTHRVWDHDLSWSRTLNRLSHPGAPKMKCFNKSRIVPTHTLGKILQRPVSPEVNNACFHPFLLCKMIRKLHIWMALLYSSFHYQPHSINVIEMFCNHKLMGKIEKDSLKWQLYYKNIFEGLFSL